MPHRRMPLRTHAMVDVRRVGLPSDNVVQVGDGLVHGRGDRLEVEAGGDRGRRRFRGFGCVAHGRTVRREWLTTMVHFNDTIAGHFGCRAPDRPRRRSDTLGTAAAGSGTGWPSCTRDPAALVAHAGQRPRYQFETPSLMPMVSSSPRAGSSLATVPGHGLPTGWRWPLTEPRTTRGNNRGCRSTYDLGSPTLVPSPARRGLRPCAGRWP